MVSSKEGTFRVKEKDAQLKQQFVRDEFKKIPHHHCVDQQKTRRLLNL